MIIQRFILLAIVLSLTAGCATYTFSPTPTSPPPGHFENNLVAFNYPAGARIFAAGDPTFNPYSNFYKLGGKLVVGLANPNWMDDHGILFSSIGIFRHTLPASSSLANVM